MLRNGTTGDWIGTFEGHKAIILNCVTGLSFVSRELFGLQVWTVMHCMLQLGRLILLLVSGMRSRGMKGCSFSISILSEPSDSQTIVRH